LPPSSTALSCFATPEYGANAYLQGYFYPLFCLTSQKMHGISLANCHLDKEQNNHKEQAMPIDEQETRRNTVVTETPAARHEVTQTRREYTAEPRGTSNAAVAVLVILAIAVLGLLGLLFWSMQANSNNDNLAAQQQTPQTSQQPVIVQQPAAPAAQPPIIVNPPAAAPVSGAPSGAEALTGPDDGAIQMAVDKKLLNDPTFSKLGITATVSAGKVLLVGSVKAETLKNQIERAVKSIKGVKSVDNQISVISG
jgi:hypothetical protein